MDSAQTIQQIVESEGFQTLSPQVKVALFLGGMAMISAALARLRVAAQFHDTPDAKGGHCVVRWNGKCETD